VHELVEHENVALARERGRRAERGHVARAEDACGLASLEGGELLLKRLVQARRAGHEPRGAAACAVVACGRGCRPAYALVVRKI
jgi:hypothetical protein